MKPQIKQIIDPLKGNRKNVCIVLPTFNQYNETKKNIELLKQQTLIPDIIIVDNNSSDGTFEKLSKEFKDIILINTGGNFGGAGGFYIGQKRAYKQGYEYIILNDNDAYPVDKDLIENLIKINNFNETISATNIAEQNINFNFNFVYTIHYNMYHRKFIEKVGFINYNLFIYGDEIEYYNRTKKYGIKFKKCSKKYYHPLKNYYPAKMIYFLVRNQNYNNSLYNSFKIHLINNFKALLANIIYKKLWGLDYHYYFFKEGIKDSLNKNFYRNQEIISSTLNNNITFKKEKVNDFFDKHKNNKKVLFSLKKIFNGKEIEKEIKIKNIVIPRKEIFGKKIIITTGFNSFDRIILTMFFNKVIFIKDIDCKKNEIEYFEFTNNFFKKIKIILEFLFKLPSIFYKTIQIRRIYKNINPVIKN